jgi:hypothetical protein
VHRLLIQVVLKDNLMIIGTCCEQQQIKTLLGISKKVLYQKCFSTSYL